MNATPYGGPPLVSGANSQQADDPRFWQRGNIKQPPGWNPSVQSSYPFRSWLMDVMAWSIYTDLQDHQKGMALELVLGGDSQRPDS